jgi:hypothetical protein
MSIRSHFLRCEKLEESENKRLTGGLKIDNLRKFAKTSNVAEVLLDRLK